MTESMAFLPQKRKKKKKKKKKKITGHITGYLYKLVFSRQPNKK